MFKLAVHFAICGGGDFDAFQEQLVVLLWRAVSGLRAAPERSHQLIADKDKTLPRHKIVDGPGRDDGGVNQQEQQAAPAPALQDLSPPKPA